MDPIEITTCNCTAWASLRIELESNLRLKKADIILVQEHKLAGSEAVGAARKWASKAGWRFECIDAVKKNKAKKGDAGAEASERWSGGVGILWRPGIGAASKMVCVWKRAGWPQ